MHVEHCPRCMAQARTAVTMRAGESLAPRGARADRHLLDVELRHGPDAPGEARADVGEVVDDIVDEPRLWDVILLTSELVTNAVRHGERGPIRLRVIARSYGVRVEVTNGGSNWGAGPRRRAGDDGRPGGLGLALLDRLSDRWNTVDDEPTVWFEIDAKYADGSDGSGPRAGAS
jgi:anti-sigma regulatory factor (Ser/Thr protein kinase)